MTPFSRKKLKSIWGRAFWYHMATKPTITVLDYSAEQGNGEAVGELGAQTQLGSQMDRWAWLTGLILILLLTDHDPGAHAL